LLDERAERYASHEAFEHAVRGAASVVTHLYRGGFSPELWAGERAPGLRAGSRYTEAMELLATVRPVPHVDIVHTVNRLRRSGVGGGALVVVTGTPDEGILGAYRILSRDFSRTVVMAVTPPGSERMLLFQRAGAVTVAVGADAPWAPAWRTSMELSWSAASAG
jgi:hypothetical protein